MVGAVGGVWLGHRRRRPRARRVRTQTAGRRELGGAQAQPDHEPDRERRAPATKLTRFGRMRAVARSPIKIPVCLREDACVR